MLVNREAPPVFVDAVVSNPLGADCVDVPEALLTAGSSKLELPAAVDEDKRLIEEVPVP